jgi:hypothetical protein
MPKGVAWILAVSIGASLLSADEATTRVNKGASPALGIEAEVGTGDVVYAEWERSELEYARLRSPVKVSDTGMTLPKGLLLESSIAVGGRKDFCVGYESALYCFQDTDDDHIFERVKIVGGARPLPRISGPYTLESQARGDLPGWRKEIVYQGASAGVMRFTFREFGSDWTTPRESREVTYDLAPGGSSEVVYQGAKLEVRSATSNSLRFKLVAGFRPRP